MRMIINSGFYQILGTDRFENTDKSFGEKFEEYRKKWFENPRKRIIGDFPLHVDVESTNACNLKCIMCSRNFMMEKIGYMDWGLYKKIIDECGEHHLPSLKLNFRGEPLLHPDLPKMVKYAKDRGILEVQFNTNGLLLTEKKAEELIKAGLDRIIFSFDGATKKTYEKIRRGSNFDTVKKNIERLVEIRNSMGLKRPSVRVQMCKMEGNEHEVEHFINMWINIANRVAVTIRREPFEKGESIHKSLQHFPCPQLWQRIVVLWDGKVVMCCGDWHAEYVLGDAKKQKIHELWRDEKYIHARELHARGRFNDLPICARCEVNTPLRDDKLETLLQKYKFLPPF